MSITAFAIFSKPARTIAAAGYVEGMAVSFGWPRPDDATFLEVLASNLRDVWRWSSCSRTAARGPRAWSKDDGIDVIAWRQSPDGLPGIASAAKSVGRHERRERRRIATSSMNIGSRDACSRHQDAMFMPFCLEPKNPREDAKAQEVLVDLMQRLTSKYGLMFYRYRIASFSAIGLTVHQSGRAVVERVSDLPRVET